MHPSRVVKFVGVALAATTVFGLTTSARADTSVGASSLPSVSTGHRPGPDALYQQPLDSVAGTPGVPQLQNTGPWTAPPILISGSNEYTHGEYLYQGFLYDDHGAAGVADPNAPIGASGFLFSPTAGTYTYPTNPVYGYNAADLVEFRVKPVSDCGTYGVSGRCTAFRVTLNVMNDPALVGFTVALGGEPGILGNIAWPYRAGVSSPADYFLTVHGTTGVISDAHSGATLAPAPIVNADITRKQFDVYVPADAWSPGNSGTATVRMTVGVGLWDTTNSTYLVPSTQSATATTPGGGTPTGVAIVDSGPRLNEPFPALNDPTSTWTLGDSAVGAAVQGRWWRESQQAASLRTGDVSPFFANVNFATLHDGLTDTSGVPTTGAMDRILASHYSFPVGTSSYVGGFDPSQICFQIAPSIAVGAACKGRFVGQLQPYALYVPKTVPLGGRYGMTLLLHSLSANYNQYSASNNQSQLGERSTGSIVLTPGGRGPDGFNAGYAEVDAFEAWADVAWHYPLDSRWNAVSGYSMGGYGTYWMLARYPDLFAKGMSTVGIPGPPAAALVPNLRNDPFMAWNVGGDELVNIQSSTSAEAQFAADGLRFVWWLFPAADHLTLATNDEYQPAADFLGSDLAPALTDHDPAHVTFVVQPGNDRTDLGAMSVASDHAYWLSGVTERVTTLPTGEIDIVSQAFGEGDPTPSGVSNSAGVLAGGNHAAMPYVSFTQTWGPTPVTLSSPNALAGTATNLSAITVDATRAKLSCASPIDLSGLHTDGKLQVTIDCPGGATQTYSLG